METGFFIYLSGVNLDSLDKFLAASMSSASKELIQGSVGIDCFLRGKLPGKEILSFEPLFRLGLKFFEGIIKIYYFLLLK